MLTVFLIHKKINKASRIEVGEVIFTMLKLISFIFIFGFAIIFYWVIAFRLAKFLVRKRLNFIFAVLFPLISYVSLTFAVLLPLYIYMGDSLIGSFLAARDFLRILLVDTFYSGGGVGYVISAYLGARSGRRSLSDRDVK